MQPNPASRSFASPTSPKKGNLGETTIPTDSSTTGDYLTGTQEDYFLGLFWQSYHCTLQIIDEVAFREHYKSLWPTSGTSRNPSALVLALCMQYGVAFVPRSSAAVEPKVDVDSNNATIAGRWLYRRSQTLLACELESPSITTLQCYIFSVYYLCSASFNNMASQYFGSGSPDRSYLRPSLEGPCRHATEPAVYQLTIKNSPCSQAPIFPPAKMLPGLPTVYKTRNLSWRLVPSISHSTTSVQIFSVQTVGQHFIAILKPSKIVLSSSCRVWNVFRSCCTIFQMP